MIKKTILIIATFLFFSLLVLTFGGGKFSVVEGNILESSNYYFPLSTIDNIGFAGYNWGIEAKGQNSFGVSNDFDEDDFLILKASANSNRNREGRGTINAKTDLTDVDEIILVVQPTGTASHGSPSDGASSIVFNLLMYNGGKGCSLGAEGCSIGSGSCTLDDRPRAVKIMNNFDGTWSSYTTLGVGDIWIKDRVCPTSDNILYLQMDAHGGYNGQTTGQVTIYNIVTKEDETSICKIDELMTVDGCENLKSILLAYEESLHESYDEKLARIEERLNQKIDGLSTQINDNTNLENLENLQIELASLKMKLEATTLSDVEIESLQTQIDILTGQINSGVSSEELQIKLNNLKVQLETTSLTDIEISNLQRQIDNFDINRIKTLEIELANTKAILKALEEDIDIAPQQIDVEEIIKELKIDNEATVKEVVSNYIVSENIKDSDVNNVRYVIPSWIWITGIVLILIIIVLLILIWIG
ncbi:hypothetical protein KKG81_04500 [bacterium]|nr:hypothetical protein [bacterium]